MSATHADHLLQIGRELSALIRDAAETHQGAEKYLSCLAESLELLAQARSELNGLSYLGSKAIARGK